MSPYLWAELPKKEVCMYKINLSVIALLLVSTSALADGFNQPQYQPYIPVQMPAVNWAPAVIPVQPPQPMQMPPMPHALSPQQQWRQDLQDAQHSSEIFKNNMKAMRGEE